MPTTRKRLFGPAQLSNAAATKYTVPALTKTIIRYIHVQNPSAATTFTMSIGSDAAGTRIYDAAPILAGQVLPIWCYHVMDAAEILQALAAVASQVVVTIVGDEITLG